MKSLPKLTFFSKSVLATRLAKPAVVKLPDFRPTLYAYIEGRKSPLRD